MSVKPIPEGYQPVIPYLVVKDAAAQMDFIINALQGEEIERLHGPGGMVMHGEVRLGGNVIMIGQAREGDDAVQDSHARQAMIYHYVENCDEVYAHALKNGGTSISEPTDQFYGDRHGAVKDPNGNSWYIASRVEDVDFQEIQERMKKMRG